MLAFIWTVLLPQDFCDVPAPTMATLGGFGATVQGCAAKGPPIRAGNSSSKIVFFIVMVEG